MERHTAETFSATIPDCWKVFLYLQFTITIYVKITITVYKIVWHFDFLISHVNLKFFENFQMGVFLISVEFF